MLDMVYRCFGVVPSVGDYHTKLLWLKPVKEKVNSLAIYRIHYLKSMTRPGLLAVPM